MNTEANELVPVFKCLFVSYNTDGVTHQYEIGETQFEEYIETYGGRRMFPNDCWEEVLCQHIGWK